ncbi:MAG: hypothetical protein HXY39_01565 [Chloroflexi bacterium]|nr:hypothetical protein [Chloroflexota bacterium]
MEKNAVPPAGGHWHAPGWPIARVTAYLQSLTRDVESLPQAHSSQEHDRRKSLAIDCSIK